jgi:hypothetical protein
MLPDLEDLWDLVTGWGCLIVMVLMMIASSVIMADIITERVLAWFN